MIRHRLGYSCWLVLLSGLSVSAAIYEVSQRTPQANDANPGNSERPWRTITRAAEKARPGDTILIRDGVYRERVVAKVSGSAEAPIIFEAAPGAHVVVTGADRLTDWKKVTDRKPIYQVPWPHCFIGWSKQMTHPDDAYHLLIGRCEQVAVDGYLLRQVLEFNQLAPGTFFVDISNQVLSAWDCGNRDLNKVLAEGSVRQEIFRAEGDNVQVRGLHFRFAANMAQHGAVVLAGKYDTLEDCVIEYMNSSGATFSSEHEIVRRCVFRENGQLGFGANGAHDLLFTECLVENNNIKAFDRGWEAGGDKLVLCRNAILERSRFLRNRGNGIWFDIGNEQCSVRHCLIADNEDSGIFYEISYGLRAQDNVIVGNGFSQTAGAWGAQAGISLSSSPECLIERNLIVGNREGFNFREQTRTTPRIGKKGEAPVWNHDEIIRRNIIALNRDAQIWGWFDVKDNRHWPVETTQNESASKQLILANLRLTFVDNVYFAEPGQGLFEWGVTWARHRSYANLNDFQKELGIDVGSRVFNPSFANLRTLDVRVSPESMATLKGSYPEGPVPGAILGVQQ
jgi:Right handed beta helix region/Protein of unknown function (DUF1565)